MSNLKYLIIPSSLSLSPYVFNYLEGAKNRNEKVRLVIWDRLHNFSKDILVPYENVVDEVFIYTDRDKSIRKKSIEYYRYKKYVLKKIIRNIDVEDELIVFSPQLFLFLYRNIKKMQISRLYIDVRDYHKSVDILNFLDAWDEVDCIIVSSPFFSEFIKTDYHKIIVNHNFLKKREQLNSIDFKTEIIDVNNQIVIGSIGAFRDWELNHRIINSLANDTRYRIVYNGEGLDSEQLKMYIKDKNILNVFVSGFYEYKEIPNLYGTITLSNVFRDSSSKINKYALPNRLYDSLYYGTPLICNDGNAVADVISENKLGIVINNLDNLKVEIESKVSHFDMVAFKINSTNFLKKAILDNEEFEHKIFGEEKY
ncbi:glycosyltransferase [Erysipelothrix rhusiopathiae]|uniref:Glycosyl transferases, group 1 n=1 Tax=Erysipelothrix rhusiopathiae TaxID=1648 RepID=A0A4V0P1A2_ERYRH|nr:glycosyltransferase [Erysipelothrix rhusiopathiae]AYV34067.1 hypothetical protein EEY85_01635 [Erysipelothrix rhusiopathiae]BBE36394.1 glycosyl transferases, group 1 [Erysipelothrix rhusiopathiae]